MSFEDQATQEEVRQLAPWRAAYEAFYGRAPELRQEKGGLFSLSFRHEHDRFDLFRRMMGSIGGFANKPRMLAHLRTLGFDWDEDGVLLQIPTPRSFRARVDALGLPSSGFTAEVVLLDALGIPAGAWLSWLVCASLPINVGTTRLYARERLTGPSGASIRTERSERWKGSMIHHLLCLPHDTTKHLLVSHLVPRPCLEDLGERARVGFGPPRRWLAGDVSFRLARPFGVLPRACLAPVPLLVFYENDLYDYCRSVWRVIDTPQDFAPTFTKTSHYRQLLDVLGRRVAQATRVGAFWRDAPPRPYARFEIGRPSPPSDPS